MCKAGKDDLKEVVLTVQKLQVEAEGGNLESALAGVAGVQSVQLQVPEKRVVVGFTGCRSIVERLIEVADKAGFALSAA